MSEWKTAKLNDLCLSITDGDHQAPPKSKSGIPFITISNLDSALNTINFAECSFVPKEYYDSLSESRRPKRGDILYSVVGSFGIPILVKDDLPFVFQRHIAILRPNSNVCPAYLAYVMKSREFYHWADNVAIGAAQRTVTLKQLREKEITLPDVKTQERIAGVLSAYDELIENRRKQIKLLEEAAQRLYKEWFVDLKFPGHEAASINPETNLPEGWRVLSAADVFPITIGKTPSRKDSSAFSNEGIPWVSVSDMGKEGSIILSTSECLTQEGINSYKVKTVPEGSVLLSFKLTVGRVSIAGCTMASNEAIAHFVTDNNALRNYCFLYLKNFDFSKLGSTSSIGTAINSKIVKALPFVLPDETTLKSFDDVASSIIELIISNKRQIALLQEARDRMLPKLVSGEIEVG